MIEKYLDAPWLIYKKEKQDQFSRLVARPLVSSAMRWALGHITGSNETPFLAVPSGYNLTTVESGKVNAYLFEPKDFNVEQIGENDKIVLYFHGGGFYGGGGLYSKFSASQIVRQLNISALSVDYRLAPEHPYPAALEDALAGYKKLLSWGYSPKNIILSGDSSGGNLSLSLPHKLRELDMPFPGAIVVFSPAADLVYSSDKFEGSKDPIIPLSTIKKVLTSYTTKENYADPCVSPVNGNLDDYPPTYICVDEDEILLAGALEMADNLHKAGGTVLVHVSHNLYHVFPIITPMLPESKNVYKEILDFLKKTMSFD